MAVLHDGGLTTTAPQEPDPWLHHRTLRSRSGPPIELHYALTNDLALTLDTASLLEARGHLGEGPSRLPTLGLVETFVYQVLHAAVHLCARLAWLVDLVGLLEAVTAVWDQVLATANAWGATLALQTTLGALDTLVGAGHVPPGRSSVRLGAGRVAALEAYVLARRRLPGWLSWQVDRAARLGLSDRLAGLLLGSAKARGSASRRGQEALTWVRARGQGPRQGWPG